MTKLHVLYLGNNSRQSCSMGDDNIRPLLVIGVLEVMEMVRKSAQGQWRSG